jgi:transcriptional regulator with XRE-family HTH domain
VPRSKRDAVPNRTLYNLRDALAQSQEDVAAALNALAAKKGKTAAVTGNQVSRWERGVVYPSPFYRQLLAEHFGVSVAELGLVRQRLTPLDDGASLTATGDVLLIDSVDPTEDPEVMKSRHDWLQVRHQINSQHDALAASAAQLYPEEVRVGGRGVITRPDWHLSPPIDLDDIKVAFDLSTEPPAIDGTEDATSHVRPLWRPGRRYQRYSHAIRDVARPTLFENRLCWRLVNAELSQAGGTLSFGFMNYFDAMDTCEAVAHEMAAKHVVNGTEVAPASWRGLKFRKALGDPFDLRHRALLISINTLTIRLDKGGAASVILHNRDASNVATSGGIVGVMPAGVFQPSTVRSGDHEADFDLWRNIMREYSEEFLGNPEHSGDGPAADYNEEPFRSLDAARQVGQIRVHTFGLAFGALDLWGALETVAVIEAEVFDDIFEDLVHVNDEGWVVKAGKRQPTVHIPFTKDVIDELHATNRLAPETSFSLRSAWKHREQLLGSRSSAY